jgi:DNA phosphorothioation-dependent restriction protein DptG
MEESKVNVLLQKIRYGEQAEIFKEYSVELFQRLRVQAMSMLESSDVKEGDVKAIFRAMKMIENLVQLDINNAKQATRKVSGT